MVGKYKEYRKLVGVSQIKTHSGVPDLNMSQKRRKTLSMSSGQQPPTQELTLQKTNRRGKLISDAIQEIIFNLEKYDKAQAEDAQGETEAPPGGQGPASGKADKGKRKKRGTDAETGQPYSPSRKAGPYKSFEAYGAGSRLGALSNSGQQQDKQMFLPRLAKQKVLDKFIDLSTADVFHRTGLWPQKAHPKGGSNVVAVQPLGQTSLIANVTYAGARRDLMKSAMDQNLAAVNRTQTQYMGVSMANQMKQNI